MWEPLRRFSALQPGARSLFLRAVLLLPLVSLSLRLRGFRATQASLQNYLSNAQPTKEASAGASQLALTARAVRSAAYRSFGKATCLEKSLTLWWLLERQGIASSVRIGTRKDGEKLEAHAWVEYDGIALHESEDVHRHYAAFDEAFPVAAKSTKK
jgi:hypothetical protein